MRKSIEKELINSISNAIPNHLLLFRHYNLNLIIVLTPRSTTTALKEENGRGGLNMITYSNIIVWHVIN